MPAFVPPPADNNWESRYEEIGKFLKRYDELTTPLGLIRHPDKGAILIPTVATMPSQSTYSGIDLAKMTVIDGVKIGGGFIGTDAYIAASSGKKPPAAKDKIDSIMRLAPLSAFVAIQLLGLTANHALNYYARVTPPCLAHHLYEGFDNHMEDARIKCCLLDGGTMAQTSQARLLRARTIATSARHMEAWDTHQCSGRKALPLLQAL